MQFIIGPAMIIVFLLLITVPYLLIDATRDMNPVIGLAIVWAMFGLGYVYGKSEQRRQTKAREERLADEKALDERDRQRGIGKYAKPTK